MVFDPVSQSWSGNESTLDVFNEPKAPTLIPHTSSIPSHESMIFDPELMKWIGNESEMDVFDHILPMEPEKKCTND